MTQSDKYKLVTILFVITLLLSLVYSGNSQSIMINNSGTYMLEMSEEEKAVKSSSTMIKAKTDLSWETHINSIPLQWKVTYNKELKIYTLFRNGLKYYESSTIAGIRSKYASDLLGRNINIQ